jgi:hypothetical protein
MSPARAFKRTMSAGLLLAILVPLVAVLATRPQAVDKVALHVTTPGTSQTLQLEQLTPPTTAAPAPRPPSTTTPTTRPAAAAPVTPAPAGTATKTVAVAPLRTIRMSSSAAPSGATLTISGTGCGYGALAVVNYVLWDTTRHVVVAQSAANVAGGEWAYSLNLTGVAPGVYDLIVGCAVAANPALNFTYPTGQLTVLTDARKPVTSLPG